MTYRQELEAFFGPDVLREAIECGREAFLCLSHHNTTPMYEEIYMRAARDYCLGEKLAGDFESSVDLDKNIAIGILAFPAIDLIDPAHWPESVMSVMHKGVPHLAKLNFNMSLLDQLDDLQIPQCWADILIYVGFAEVDGLNAAIPALHAHLRHSARLTLKPNTTMESAQYGGFLSERGPDGLRFQ